MDEIMLIKVGAAIVCAFLLGIGMGIAAAPGIIAYFVRKDGQLTLKWGGRWYRVQGRNRR